MIEVCATAEELRKALDALEKAASRGFTHSLAVFELVKVGPMLDDAIIKFRPQLIDKAHPTKENLDWGRQGASEYCRVVKGKLIEDADEI